MTNQTNQPTPEQTPEKSAGTYTSEQTPVDLGNETQGQYDFRTASATPKK